MSYNDVSQLSGRDPVLKSAAISIAGMGDNTVVAAVTGQRVKVMHLSLFTSGAVNVQVKSGAGTNLTGAFTFLANQGWAFDAAGGNKAMMTTAGDALVVNLSAAVTVTGYVQFFQEA